MLTAEQYAAMIMLDIRELVASGRIPRGLSDFAQLHDYCDPNMLVIDHCPWAVIDPANEEHAAMCTLITDLVSDLMLAARRDGLI